MKSFSGFTHRFLKISSVVALYLLSHSTVVFSSDFDKAWMISKFVQLDNAINAGEGYSKSTNEGGALSWAESYLLEAYLDMYSATGDRKWLDKFISHAESVMKSTDKARNLADYMGRRLAGWSSQRYSRPFGWKKGDPVDLTTQNKPRVVLCLNTGMIVYPLTKFARLVKDNVGLKAYAAKAAEFTRFAEEAAAVFDSDWRYDQVTGEGWFVVDKDMPVNWNYDSCAGSCRDAINGDLAIGRVYLNLYKLTGKEVYYRKAKALSVKFKNNLKLINGMYVWKYRYKEDEVYNSNYEDISHGAIDVSFAYEAYKNGIVFTNNDLKAFAATIVANYKMDEKLFAKYVDGTGRDEDHTYSDASGRWLDLSDVSCQNYKVVKDYMKVRLRDSTKEHPQLLLGLAKLVKYNELCAR